jgi:hypothetical protein
MQKQQFWIRVGFAAVFVSSLMYGMNRPGGLPELLPILLGLLLGNLFVANLSVFLKSFWTRAGLVLTVGIATTVVSGEYRQSWGFALVDCSEAALAAWIGFVAATHLHRVSPGRQTEPMVKL